MLPPAAAPPEPPPALLPLELLPPQAAAQRPTAPAAPAYRAPRLVSRMSLIRSSFVRRPVLPIEDHCVLGVPCQGDWVARLRAEGGGVASVQPRGHRGLHSRDRRGDAQMAA